MEILQAHNNLFNGNPLRAYNPGITSGQWRKHLKYPHNLFSVFMSTSTLTTSHKGDGARAHNMSISTCLTGEAIYACYVVPPGACE